MRHQKTGGSSCFSGTSAGLSVQPGCGLDSWCMFRSVVAAAVTDHAADHAAGNRADAAAGHQAAGRAVPEAAPTGTVHHFQILQIQSHCVRLFCFLLNLSFCLMAVALDTCSNADSEGDEGVRNAIRKPWLHVFCDCAGIGVSAFQDDDDVRNRLNLLPYREWASFTQKDGRDCPAAMAETME